MANESPGGTPEAILEAAERRMRRGGYDAVSFRDLADDVGIKSASVHYHFPQKADLGQAVVARYGDRLLAALGAPDDPAEGVADRIARLCDVYRAAAVDEGLICLCCMLGGQSLDLPPPVSDAVAGFFERMLAWIGRALRSPGGGAPPISAAQVIASLQGAMVLAIALRRPELFEDTRSRVLRDATGTPDAL